MNRPEQNLQKGYVVPYLETVEHAGRIFFFHPENGGFRTKAEGGIGKAMGRRPGVPDLMILSRIGRLHMIELKPKPPSKRYANDLAAGKRFVFDDPRLSKVQKKFVATATALGFGVAVCHSVDGVREALIDWQIIGPDEFPIERPPRRF